jgi:hypothetical protein
MGHARWPVRLPERAGRRNPRLADAGQPPGLNDGPEAASGIAAFADRVGRILVNVIPYNPGSVPIGRAPDGAETDAFVGALRSAGLDARVRSPRGRSLMAACGQLGGSPEGNPSRDWFRPEVQPSARPSSGTSRESIGTESRSCSEKP